MNYRLDIQVLRGLAVLSVVLYHLFPGQIKSGYLGVDVFFVISGFLMAALYQRPGAKNPIHDFYLRRFHRLLPAYLATLITAVLVGAFLLIPHEYEDLASQSLSALTLVSNIYYWTGESYFGGLDFRPLLHTWSLGLELQFYLLVPLCYWAYKKLKILYFIGFLSSFIMCFIVLGISSKSSFFLLPFRVWEFLIGFTVALMLSNNGNIKFPRPLLGTSAFLGLIAMSCVETSLKSHPGFTAMLTCILVAFVISMGLSNRLVDSYIGRFFVLLGKYSYSLYLVHFPIIVFIFYSPFGGGIEQNLTILKLLLAISLMFCFTVAWYKLFETKYLTNKLARSTNKLIFALATISLLAVGFGFTINKNLNSEEVALVSNAIGDRGVWRCGKLGKLKKVLDSSKVTCRLTEVADARGDVLLIGDSHADSIKDTLTSVSINNGFNLHLMVQSCNLGRGDCDTKKILNLVDNMGIKKLVLHDLFYNTDYDAIDALINELPEGVQLYLVDPIPTWPESVPLYLYRQLEENYESAVFKKNITYFKSKLKGNYENLDKLESRGLIRIETLGIFCDDDCKLISEDGMPYYFDNHHLTNTGAELLRPSLNKIFN